MINFFDVNFNRVIVHKIIQKTKDTDEGSVIHSSDIISLSPKLEQTIQDRLYEGSRGSKFFKLAVGDSMESSFFGYSKDLHDTGEEQFVEYTGKIAEILASAQKSSSIPGGYLIIIEGITHRQEKRVIIAIKAELHEAMHYSSSEINLIEDVFLSPSKKFFKYGVLYELNEAEKEEQGEMEYPNDNWAALLFDQQFRPESNLAEYFYRDFLGFTTEKNAKIQSKRFFNETEKFIMDNVLELNSKRDMLNVLDYEFTESQEHEVSPKYFADSYLHDEAMNADYKNEIAEYLPAVIEKDASLIKSKIFNKKINFPNKIKISGPKDAIDANMQIIQSQEELKDLSTQQDSYTIIKIEGKPFDK